RLDQKNSIMFTVIVRHQLSGHPGGIPCRADRRNSATPISATLASTFPAESQRGALDRHRLATAAGSKATDPSRQTRPRSPQYSRRCPAAKAMPEVLSWTAQVKLGTSIPTNKTSASPAFVARAASEPEKAAVTTAPAANQPAVAAYE